MPDEAGTQVNAEPETSSAAAANGTGTVARVDGTARARTPPTAAGTADAPRLEDELDRVSLTQALIDAEIATARVIDLTERLVDARGQLAALRGELEALRLEHLQYKAEQERIRSSRAYRLAERIWSIRNVLGV